MLPEQVELCCIPFCLSGGISVKPAKVNIFKVCPNSQQHKVVSPSIFTE